MNPETLTCSECPVEGRIFEPVKGYLILGHVKQPETIHPFRLASPAARNAIPVATELPEAVVAVVSARRSSGEPPRARGVHDGHNPFPRASGAR